MSATPDSYPTSAFDYELPPELIAQYPVEQRDASRLLVLHRSTGAVEHRRFSDLRELIAPGDALVLNETRVIPARLVGEREGGGAAEVLLLRPVAGAGGPPGKKIAPGPGHLHGGTRHSRTWTALVRPGSKLRPGRSVRVADDLSIAILDVLDDGTRVVELRTPLEVDAALERYGRMPLPPYMRREAQAADRERYQTVYARREGSVAAPTAGLHFTAELLELLAAHGVAIVHLVLHVGVGTFRPVETEDPASHRMHSEWYEVSEEAAARLNRVRAAGGAVWSVGTTVTRTLETVADERGTVHAGSGWTDIFLRPPYTFRAIDRLITNFHLPRSTLLMLVAAFGGYEPVMRAYDAAVRERYRFYSYGDAMAIV